MGKNELNLNHKNRITLRLSFINTLVADNLKFYELIKKIESNQCYKILSGEREEKVIRKKRFFYAWNYNLGDRKFPEKNDVVYAFSDISREKRDIISIIRKLGIKKFERCFLNEFFPLTEISKMTGIDVKTAEKIRDFVRGFILANENMEFEKLPVENFNLIAAVEIYRGKPYLEYILPFYADGLYEIDNKKLSKLKKHGIFKGLERELDELIFDIKRVNFRKNILHRILNYLIEYQKDFITGKAGMKPLSMRDLSTELGMNVSIISRAVAGKYLKLPDGNNLKLSSFFYSRKDWAIAQISDILEKRKSMKGRDLSLALFKKTGVRISVRTVNHYKKLLIENKV